MCDYNIKNTIDIKNWKKTQIGDLTTTQELDRKVQTLETDNQSLKTENASLKTEVGGLRSELQALRDVLRDRGLID